MKRVTYEVLQQIHISDFIEVDFLLHLNCATKQLAMQCFRKRLKAKISEGKHELIRAIADRPMQAPIRWHTSCGRCAAKEALKQTSGRMSHGLHGGLALIH